MSEPAALIARRTMLQDRIDTLEHKLQGRMRDRDDAKTDDATIELTLQIANILTLQARASEFMRDLERPTTILLFEQQEQEARERRMPQKREGHIEVPAEPVADGLAAASVDDIIKELRIKKSWSYQRVADFLIANGKTKKNGNTNWHTSDVYGVYKRLMRAA